MVSCQLTCPISIHEVTKEQGDKLLPEFDGVMVRY